MIYFRSIAALGSDSNVHLSNNLSKTTSSLRLTNHSCSAIQPKNAEHTNDYVNSMRKILYVCFPPGRQRGGARTVCVQCTKHVSYAITVTAMFAIVDVYRKASCLHRTKVNKTGKFNKLFIMLLYNNFL